MTELETKLRERTSVDELLVKKITTVAEGRQAVEYISTFMSELLNEMASRVMNNEMSQVYTDVRYDLKTARHNIQSQMTRLVRLKHNAK